MKNSWEHISAAGTYVLDPNGGVLKSITINTATGGVCTVYDGITVAGRVIASIKSATAEQTLFYDIPYVTGLTIVLATSGDLTVVFT
jgi:hypothetical protein